MSTASIFHPATAARRLWEHFQSDSLFRNSLYILASTAIISVSGFLFWFFAAHLYTSSEVGLASTIISACALIISISSLGIANAFIRYIPPSTNKQELVSSGTILVTVSTLVITLGYLLLLPLISPDLDILITHPLLGLLFIGLTVASALSSLIDSIFIASRSAHFNLATYSIIGGVKIVGVLLLVALGTTGLFFSHTLGLVCSIIAGYYFIQRYLGIQLIPRYNHNCIKAMFAFSGMTYVTSLISAAPSFILPLIILHARGPSEVAYFYMAMMIAVLIFAVPNSVTSSLFAEGSHDSESVGDHFKRATMLIGGTLLAANGVIVFFGHFILSILGKEYSAQGYWPLVWLTLSSFFLATNSLFSTALKIEGRLHGYLFINLCGAVITIAGSYFFIGHGLTYVAASWFAGQLFMSGCFAIDYLIAK